MFDIIEVTLYRLLLYLRVFVRPVQHNSSYFVDIIVLFMCIHSTSLTLNKTHTNLFLVILFIYTTVLYIYRKNVPMGCREKELNIYVITDIPVRFPSYSISQLYVPWLYCNPPGIDGMQVHICHHPHHISLSSLM